MSSRQRQSQRLSRGRAPRGLLVLLGVAALAAGCASPGDPTPRRPIIPQAVQDLQARQQGGFVVLSFTLPSESTRNEPLPAAPAIEIYRGEVTSGTPSEKASTKLVYTIPGEMAGAYEEDGRLVYRDAVESGATAGAEVVYFVRTRAARNRASAESNRALVRVYAAPAAVGNVVARVAGQSVTLTWPRTGSVAYRVYRAEIAPESVPAASVDASRAALRMPLVQVAQINAPADGSSESLLRYEDENVVLGHAYLYILRGVGQFGADAVESADSNPAAIAVVETVPPGAPQDVEAVAVSATGMAPAHIALSWAISSEEGVAGYAVYRSEQEGARGARLNEDLAGSPTYRDESVTPGQRYFYSVTVVDAAGQESVPSAQTEAQVPQGQP